MYALVALAVLALLVGAFCLGKRYPDWRVHQEISEDAIARHLQLYVCGDCECGWRCVEVLQIEDICGRLDAIVVERSGENHRDRFVLSGYANVPVGQRLVPRMKTIAERQKTSSITLSPIDEF